MNFSHQHVQDSALLGQSQQLWCALCLFPHLVLILSPLCPKYARQKFQQVFHWALVTTAASWHSSTLFTAFAHHCSYPAFILFFLPSFPAALTHQFPCKMPLPSLFLLRSLAHNRKTWNLIKLAYPFPYCRWNANTEVLLQWVSVNFSCICY